VFHATQHPVIHADLSAPNTQIPSPIGNQIRMYWWCYPPRTAGGLIRPALTSSSAADRKNGSAALATMQQLMTRLGLTVNEAKTRLARLPEENFDFLGYSIGRFHGKDGTPYIGTRPSRKSAGACSSGSTTRRRHTSMLRSQNYAAGPSIRTYREGGRDRTLRQGAVAVATRCRIDTIGRMPDDCVISPGL
jgi:hypothetical protein